MPTRASVPHSTSNRAIVPSTGAVTVTSGAQLRRQPSKTRRYEFAQNASDRRHHGSCAGLTSALCERMRGGITRRHSGCPTGGAIVAPMPLPLAWPLLRPLTCPLPFFPLTAALRLTITFAAGRRRERAAGEAWLVVATITPGPPPAAPSCTLVPHPAVLLFGGV